MKIKLIREGITRNSSEHGLGLRTVVHFHGSPYKCPEFNRNQNIIDYKEWELEAVKKEIEKYGNRLLSFCGGEPVRQPEALIELAMWAKFNMYQITLFSSYTFEAILANYISLLYLIDVLVDSPYEEDFKKKLLYRNSENQRIIDVSSSMQQKKIILLNENSTKFLLSEKKGIFI